jgi:hypothetical protein
MIHHLTHYTPASHICEGAEGSVASLGSCRAAHEGLSSRAVYLSDEHRDLSHVAKACLGSRAARPLNPHRSRFLVSHLGTENLAQGGPACLEWSSIVPV